MNKFIIKIIFIIYSISGCLFSQSIEEKDKTINIPIDLMKACISTIGLAQHDYEYAINKIPESSPHDVVISEFCRGYINLYFRKFAISKLINDKSDLYSKLHVVDGDLSDSQLKLDVEYIKLHCQIEVNSMIKECQQGIEFSKNSKSIDAEKSYEDYLILLNKLK